MMIGMFRPKVLRRNNKRKRRVHGLAVIRFNTQRWCLDSAYQVAEPPAAAPPASPFPVSSLPPSSLPVSSLPPSSLPVSSLPPSSLPVSSLPPSSVSALPPSSVSALPPSVSPPHLRCSCHHLRCSCHRCLVPPVGCSCPWHALTFRTATVVCLRRANRLGDSEWWSYRHHYRRRRSPSHMLRPGSWIVRGTYNLFARSRLRPCSPPAGAPAVISPAGVVSPPVTSSWRRRGRGRHDRRLRCGQIARLILTAGKINSVPCRPHTRAVCAVFVIGRTGCEAHS